MKSQIVADAQHSAHHAKDLPTCPDLSAMNQSLAVRDDRRRSDHRDQRVT